jgi:hypothetical protein
MKRGGFAWLCSFFLLFANSLCGKSPQTVQPGVAPISLHFTIGTQDRSGWIRKETNSEMPPFKSHLFHGLRLHYSQVPRWFSLQIGGFGL